MSVQSTTTPASLHSYRALLDDLWRASPATMAAHLTRNDGLPWRFSPHLRLIDRKVVDVINGRIQRLMIMAPPRHGKSYHVSMWTPIYALAHDPNWRVGLASYGADFAAEWGRKTRDLINRFSNELEIAVDADSSAVAHWNIKGAEGGMVTAGVGGPFTGRGFQLGIIEDPIKNAEEARSVVYRERNWEWYCKTFLTRLEPNGRVILIMQRWHADDLAGRILKEHGGSWDVLRLPAVAEIDDPLGRAEGDPLWSVRYDSDALAAKKEEVGAAAWAAQYQQRPTTEEGQLLKREWWRYWTLPPDKPEFTVQYWDTAFKTGSENDYSVCITFWVVPPNIYIARVFRARLEYPELKRAMQQEYDRAASTEYRRRPDVVVIEDTAAGQSAIQELRRESALPIIADKIDRDKYARASAVSPQIEAGHVWLPQNADWVADFVEECAAFPHGIHDDQVDALTGGLGHIKEWETRRKQVAVF